ncbi:hypothetical protein COPG_00063 [Colwellia phage 9A]|uniref:Uncharacterized protein n=1 Tax=Colwellia phage 9A TaxID=765765 RepID=I3UME4_9CAUD|nr:hypothetical protein COPG_00063 [Colwellia phage 9A]AFK66659.1 hypothetical protein COPG_00063 [Colwellia phage 9A]
MSLAVDLKMRMMLDEYLGKIGAEVSGGESNERTLDLSSIGIPQFTNSSIQIFGEHSLLTVSQRDGEKDWIEGALVKNPQTIITPSKCGMSHKKNMFVIFVKTSKGHGLYYNEAVSAIVEEYFPNNTHLSKNSDGTLLTVLKSYQQPTPYLNTDLGRFQNRIFVEVEIYYPNNKT